MLEDKMKECDRSYECHLLKKHNMRHEGSYKCDVPNLGGPFFFFNHCMKFVATSNSLLQHKIP